MSLLLWTHSHSTGWFQINIMKCMKYSVIQAVAQLTVLTSVPPVPQYSYYALNMSLLKASVKKISFSTSAGITMNIKCTGPLTSFKWILQQFVAFFKFPVQSYKMLFLFVNAEIFSLKHVYRVKNWQKKKHLWHDRVQFKCIVIC